MEKELDNEVLNDDEIVECVIRQDNEMNNDADGAEIEEEDEENKMSHAEGKAALQLAATYIEQQKEATAVDASVSSAAFKFGLGSGPEVAELTGVYCTVIYYKCSIL
ncbi:hypothetical protein J6590_073610 [Homalodisca vitripennis]|nr:hypothetical protein J6590_073610 [Homalodisca vitripennis]